MKKNLFLYFAIIHVFIIIIASIIDIIDSYAESTSYINNSITTKVVNYKKSIQKILYLPLVEQYMTISGLTTGYGFFAPNVASSYLLKVDVIKKNDSTIKKTFFFPPFQTKEGINRYHTVLGSFQKRLTVLENEQNKVKSNLFSESKEYGDYLDIYIKSIGRFYYKKFDSQEYRVHCTLYLHHYPSLKELLKDKSKKVGVIKLLEINANPIKK